MSAKAILVPQADGMQIPLPVATDLSRPHWEGCREGVLRFQRCPQCQGAEFPPQPFCTQCPARELEWCESSGRGTIYSLTTVHRPQRAEFATPYTVVIVELDEGWTMLSNLIGCGPDDAHVGMAVEVTYQRLSDTVTLPYFRPV